MIDRKYDIREVRRLLGNPKEQAPTLDTIVSNMVAAEQYLLNRQAGLNKPWMHRVLTIATINATDEYILAPRPGHSIGKILHVYQDINGTSRFLTIPFVDFMEDVDNIRLNFWKANPATGLEAGIFRDGENIKIHINPTPTGVTAVSVAYTAGIVDWAAMTLEQVPLMPEFSRFRQLHAAMASIPSCQWEGLDFNQNLAQRGEIRNWLAEEFKLHESTFTDYLLSTYHEAGRNEVARRNAGNL